MPNTTSPLDAALVSAVETLHTWRQALSHMTFIELVSAFWKQIYNPPDTLAKKAILAAVLAWYASKALGWVWNAVWPPEAVVFSWPVPEEAHPEWTSRIIPNPDLFAHTRDISLLPLGANPSKFITSYDPSTGAFIGVIPLPSAADVAAQVELADAAQPAWAATSWEERRRVMRCVKAWVLRDIEEIVAVACRDTGKTRVDAIFGEILTTLAKLDWLIDNGEEALSPESRKLTLLLLHKVSKVHYVPLGTVLALVSWNYSFHNALSPILAALFSGNAVVLKCSEQVAWSSKWFIGGVRQALAACGHNPDLVQLVTCLPDVAETLTRNPKVRHVTFIGSEVVGKKVAVAAAENMVPTCIELGGKDPAFILPDADMKFFASTWMRGAFQSAGQNCIGIELYLVPRTQQQAFIDLMLPRVQSLRPGVDVGSLISHAPIARLERLIASAQASGARVLAGGSQYTHPHRPHGAYFAPTLIADVSMDMDLAREELFAPVMTVVPYDDVDSALTWLKNSRFGLGGSVYGAKRAECRRVAHALQCGMVSINDFGVFYLNQDMPFGGVKASGHGRFAGPEGVRALCAPKAVIEDRWFSVVRTSIPRPVDFPLPAGQAPWVFLTGLCRFAYGAGLARVAGLWDLIKVSVTV